MCIMLSVCEEHDKFSYQLVDVLFSWNTLNLNPAVYDR